MDTSLLGLDGGNMMMQSPDNQMMDRSLLGLDGGNMMGGQPMDTSLMDLNADIHVGAVDTSIIDGNVFNSSMILHPLKDE